MNVPIIDRYNHPHFMKPRVLKVDLKELLIKCTSKAQFRHIGGNTYYQNEGISRGKIIRSSFRKFHIEKEF